ncbi:hypothetical protein [Streptomyces sp. NPDC004685]
MTSPLMSTPRRQLAALGAIAGLCLFAWWAVQPVGGDCPNEGLTLSSDPYGSSYGPADAKGSGDVEYHGSYVPLEGDVASPGGSSVIGSGDYDPCRAETRHPRLFGWVGL